MYNHSVVRQLLLPIFKVYEKPVWGLFDLFFRLFYRNKSEQTKKIGSVLHVSYLSHKPFMLSRLMRKGGLKSEYMAIGAETGWLKVGERGYDFNLSTTIASKLLRPWIVIYYLWFVMRCYDVIHFHFAPLLSTKGWELYYLKKMNKVLVFHFRGCELRQKSVNQRLNPDLNCCQECDYPESMCENETKRIWLSLARNYGDLFFVTTPDLLDFFPEAEHIPFIAPYGIDMHEIKPAERDLSVFRVVTSSNHPGVDGTEYVRWAVQRLREEGKAIELVEVNKTPYEQALSIYKSADIYVGKLRMGYYNNANIECMVMGIPCMTYIRSEYIDKIPDCPIIVTSPKTVYENLKHYMNQPEELKKIGSQGPKMVKKYHDPSEVLNTLVLRYEKALGRILHG